MRKKTKTLISRIVKVDGRDVHLLHMSDGSPVSEKDLQDYSLSLTVKSNRAIEAGKKMEEQRKRQRLSEPKQSFTVPKHLYKEFVFDLYSGVDFCARKYGASANDILSEAKRIAPHIVLR